MTYEDITADRCQESMIDDVMFQEEPSAQGVFCKRKNSLLDKLTKVVFNAHLWHSCSGLKIAREDVWILSVLVMCAVCCSCVSDLASVQPRCFAECVR